MAAGPSHPTYCSRESQILLLGVHIPLVPLYTPQEASAELALEAIRNTIRTVLQGNRRAASIVLSGDFNSHHPTWGGNHIQSRFTEDACELIEFFQAHSLQGFPSPPLQKNEKQKKPCRRIGWLVCTAVC